MSVMHEKEVIRSPIHGIHNEFGSRKTDYRNSAWRAGIGGVADEVRGIAGTNERSGVSSGKSSVVGVYGEEFTPRVRKSNGDITETSSVHSEEMGRYRSKETGTKNMKTLVVAQQKGGVGKTASLVHLAFDFYERGLRVAVLDLDTQSNASFTLQDFKSGYFASQLFDDSGDNLREFFKSLPSGPVMSLIESDPELANMEKRSLTDASKAFQDAINALADSGFDVVLIDTAPSLGVSLAAALFAADFVLSPIELEAYSIQGIKRMLTTIANVRTRNKKLKFLGMVPSKVDARNPRHVRHQDELRAAYPTLMVPASIGLRSSIADALASGIPVWKIKKTAARKAAQEVRALAAYVYKEMEIA